MNLYKLLNEKIKNPLRKAFLSQSNIEPLFPKRGDKTMTKLSWITMIMRTPIKMLPQEYQGIKHQYETLKKQSVEDAIAYLEDQWEEYIAEIGQPKIEKEFYEKVYEYQGIQVFVDRRYISDNYSPGSYNWRIVKNAVSVLLEYTREILPNRKPRIIITVLSKNPMTRSVEDVDKSAGMYYKKLILIDQYRMDNPKHLIHEYAHWIADRIPQQTEKMLAATYDKLLKIYFSRIKRKAKTGEEMSEFMREKISQKLGFPYGYGLLNEHEMFAVLIENWKTIPYKFKLMIKNILTRL